MEDSAKKANINLWDLIDYFEEQKVSRREDKKLWEKMVKKTLKIK